MRQGIGTAARANVNDLGEMELPRVAEVPTFLGIMVVASGEVAGQPLFAENGSRHFQHCWMLNHRVAGGRPGHQCPDATGTAQTVQAVWRGVNVGAHLPQDVIAIGTRQCVLDNYEAVSVQAGEHVGIEMGKRIGIALTSLSIVVPFKPGRRVGCSHVFFPQASSGKEYPCNHAPNSSLTMPDTVRNAHPDLGVFIGKVAVITGGASGIGLALAERAIDLGLYPVLADIEAKAIEDAEAALSNRAGAAGVEVFGHTVDISDESAVQGLADAVAERFPKREVALLCCNAGVGGGGSVLRATDIDWDFVLGVNLKGVAHCIRTFVPAMLERGTKGSVVTTASQDGLCAAQGVYGVSKHACVALTEALHQELGSRLTTHVLCPNVVATNIVTSERNRPERFGGPRNVGVHPVAERFKTMGMPPAKCADYVFDAIRSGTFYIMAEADEDPGYIRLEAETRMDAMLGGGLPFRPRSAFIGRIFNPSAE